MASKPQTRSGMSQQTREALVAAGLKLFGSKGFEATSTRDIAAEANANIASIAYHFGGKDGLRVACAESIVARLKQVTGSASLVSETRFDEETALGTLEDLLSMIVGFMVVRPEARDIAAFMVREITGAGPAVDIIYDEFVAPIHKALCRLWAAATGGEAESEETRIAVFALIGQVIYFRIGQPLVLRRLEWKSVGPREAEEIIRALKANMRALIAAKKAANR